MVEITLSLSSLLTGIPLKHLEIIQIQRNRIKTPTGRKQPVAAYSLFSVMSSKIKMQTI